VTVEHLIEALRAPACYDPAPAAVQIIQTHLSVVCIAGERVYKLKKAMTLPFIDLASLSARRQSCRDEVRLNRRLCPDTYLGTAALRRIDGRLRFAAVGDDEREDDLDIAVVMRRLPQDRMLDELVRNRSVHASEIDGLGEWIADFHARAERGSEIDAYGDPRALARFAAANFAELREVSNHALPIPLLDRLEIASAANFERLLPELERRAGEGRIVDGHGDLHARNICMTDPPTVYDCLEFEPAFRCGDVATEIAFLAMDLRYRGAPDLARRFVEAYVAVCRDVRLPALLPPLCSYRAMVRAKVDAISASESELPPEQREAARDCAHQHLRLASAFVIENGGNRWLLVCGPPASGKSRLCHELASSVYWPHLATDVIRKQLAGIDPAEPASAEHYASAFSERTYATLLSRAAALTKAGAPMVMLDGNFPTPTHRIAAARAAQDAGATLELVLVDVDSETAQRRAAARQQESGHISDADRATTARLHAQFEPPTDAEHAGLILLDGKRPSGRLADEVLTRLLGNEALRPGLDGAFSPRSSRSDRAARMR
jgi:hypothetical protein